MIMDTPLICKPSLKSLTGIWAPAERAVALQVNKDLIFCSFKCKICSVPHICPSPSVSLQPDRAKGSSLIKIIGKASKTLKCLGGLTLFQGSPHAA